MKNKSRISKVNMFFRKRPKLKKALERIIIPIVLSVLISILSMAAFNIYPKMNNCAILIAAVVFLYLLFEYTFRYSAHKRTQRPYWMDVLLPLGIFAGVSYSVFFLATIKVFNHTFLPLRIWEVFLIGTKFSILAMLFFMLLFMTFIRFIGGKVRAPKKKKKFKKIVM